MAANVNTVHYPPANAEATSVITLSPVLARPGPSPRPQVPVYQLGQAQMPA